MTETVNIRHTLYEVCDCGICGVVYVVSKYVVDTQRRVGGFSSCPNGHSWGWKKDDSEEGQTRRERDRLKQQLAQRDDEIREERRRREAAEAGEYEAKKKTAKLQKRAAGGTCPCCNRTFLALQRHVANKHPEFMKENHSQFTCEKVVPIKRKATA